MFLHNGITSFFMAERDSTVYIFIHHIIFIHSFVSRHLGGFHALAIVDSAAMNIGVHESFELQFYLDICPGAGFLDHMVALFSVS